MSEEKIIILPNTKNLEIYTSKSLNNFLLPLKDYSIGFDIYFEIDEINELAKKHNIYVMINKFMHKEISLFKEIYQKFDKKINFFIEDIGLVNIIDKNRVVLYENHILSNHIGVNFLKDLGIENVVISVSVNMIHKEAYSVFHSYDECRIGQQIKLLLGEDITASPKVSASIVFIHLQITAYL